MRQRLFGRTPKIWATATLAWVVAVPWGAGCGDDAGPGGSPTATDASLGSEAASPGADASATGSDSAIDSPSGSDQAAPGAGDATPSVDATSNDGPSSTDAASNDATSSDATSSDGTLLADAASNDATSLTDGAANDGVSTDGPSPCEAGTSTTGNDDASADASGGAPVTITFDGIGADFDQPYTESGFTVTQTAGGWFPSTYGNPPPFVEFIASADTNGATGAIQVTAAGATFRFESVDLYSSVTDIPYTFLGVRNCATVFTETGTAPDPAGGFETVMGQHPTALIDTLVIMLTNAPPLGSNPIGVDNILLDR